MMSGSEEKIREALCRTPEYGEEFTREVERLRERISSAGISPVRHESDMNYSASQSLLIYLDSRFDECEDHKTARFLVNVLVSSLGKLFSIVVNEKDLTDHRRFAYPQGSCPNPVLVKVEAIKTILNGEGYTFIPKEKLEYPVKGRKTEMDGLPATAFQVIFSEMV